MLRFCGVTLKGFLWSNIKRIGDVLRFCGVTLKGYGNVLRFCGVTLKG